MNRALTDRIANAVLYEGYILYPYRPATKNRQRWTFGGVFPQAYCQANQSGDAWEIQTECLVRGDANTRFEAVVRFLNLTARSVGEVVPPLPQASAGAELPYRLMLSLQVGDQVYHAWQEAEEREVNLDAATLGELAARPHSQRLHFPGGRRLEWLRSGEEVHGVLVREQHALEGCIEAAAVELEAGLFRVTVQVCNRTLMPNARVSRDEAALDAFASLHLILSVHAGAFVSLIDPPELLREAAASCRNVGVWPVLVGVPGETDTVLCAPIILYDYPEVAPESPGDFFDGGEIDEMLMLRILTLTEEEKRAMAELDMRGSALLVRTEALARDRMMALHGTMRNLRPVT